MSAHFGTVTQCSVEPTVPKCVLIKFQNSSRFCSVLLIFGRHLRKIGICFGNWPIADFFHDQIIFLKDYELYIIGHSLDLTLLSQSQDLIFAAYTVL